MKPSSLLSKSGTVLVVVDMQDKFAKAISQFDDIIDNVARLIMTFQMYNLPIVVTEQYPAGLGQTVGRIRGLFKFLEVVEKIEFSATDNPRFWAQVNPSNPRTFVVCGIETHVCICQTAIKLVEKGLQAHVVADATGSRRGVDHNIALRKMELAGAHITTTEMCLFELAEKAGTESFKCIQRMVKGKPSYGVPVQPAPVAPVGGGGEAKKSEPIGLSALELSDVPSGDGGASENTIAASDLLQSADEVMDQVAEPSDSAGIDISNDMNEIDKLISSMDITGEKTNQKNSSPPTEGEK
jgi:nicotinamidase-related amidase